MTIIRLSEGAATCRRDEPWFWKYDNDPHYTAICGLENLELINRQNMKTQLAPEELGYTEWFVTPSQDGKPNWVVARNFDTIDTDSVTGEIYYGMSSDIDSTHDTEAKATARWREIIGTMPKNGYTYCAN